MKKLPAFLLVLAFALSLLGGALAEALPALSPDPLSLWAEDSPAKASLTDYVQTVTDPENAAYIAPADRIAVFDFDGTLYGERFPSYFDTCLFLHRVLHDEGYAADEEVRAYAEALETALLNGEPEPDAPRSTAQMAAEAFRGMTVEAYRAYVRDFMETPAWGFEGMTYAEGYFLPMVEAVQYLAENGFKVFISSGSERALVRELTEGTLDAWIPAERVIGSSFTLTASGQGDAAGRSYTFGPEDEVLLEGSLAVKNQKTNKVFSVVDEIGKAPVLVFGNSSGDLALAQYAAQRGGRAYMLLCDDTQRDYGDAEAAAAFAETCALYGYETVSMRDEWLTIYGDSVAKSAPAIFAYENDPRDNPRAMADIVENPAAVYGFSPNPESTRLGKFADALDWSDPDQVAAARAEREAYHESMSELYRMIETMLGEGKNVEEIARAVSARRNELRLEAYADDPERLALAKQSNLDTYGSEMGPSADSLYEKYGSWQTVLEKALSSNMGMDACLGLYDEYFYTYVDAAQ